MTNPPNRTEPNRPDPKTEPDESPQTEEEQKGVPPGVNEPVMPESVPYNQPVVGPQP